MDAGWSAGKEDVVEESGNRQRVQKTFATGRRAPDT
jgi:hypothetical protein